ncbi:MAG: hypothetical protein ACK53Y_24045, partial [bacterium]
PNHDLPGVSSPLAAPTPHPRLVTTPCNGKQLDPRQLTNINITRESAIGRYGLSSKTILRVSSKLAKRRGKHRIQPQCNGLQC